MSSRLSPPGKKSRTPLVQQVTPQWLFNRLQIQGGVTLIDTRGFKCYEHSHIWNFINLPPPLKTPRFSSLLSPNTPGTIHEYLDELCATESARRALTKRKLTDVVLYDHFGVYAPSSWAVQLACLLLREGAVTSLKFLVGGMQSFQRDYPFMMTSRKDLDDYPVYTPVKTTVLVDYAPRSDPSSSVVLPPSKQSQPIRHALTFPNEVVQGFLYVGNIWQATQPEILRRMGITHVLPVSDTPVPNPLKRITYMHVPSSTKHPLNLCFDDAYAFIKKARKNGGKVLINCVSGVSSSPTLAVYFLMRADKISLVEAYNDVLASRPLMFPSLACMRMLVEAELRRFGTASVRTAADIDALQGGCLPQQAV
ncbi:unnamed protein product [Aphanomyces euteiches]|nr:hypothetical protein AeRB84_017649 [Aphanomyces euteiches]